MSKNAFFSHLKSADFETFCDWSTSSWRNNLDTPWCNNFVCNNLDDVITLWCDVKIVTPQGHVLPIYRFWETDVWIYILIWSQSMVFKWHSPEILENYWLSKHDKFPRRATGQFQRVFKGWNTVFTHCARWMRVPIQIHVSLCISLRSRNFFTHRAVVATSAQCFGIGTRIHFE